MSKSRISPSPMKVSPPKKKTAQNDVSGRCCSELTEPPSKLRASFPSQLVQREVRKDEEGYVLEDEFEYAVFLGALLGLSLRRVQIAVGVGLIEIRRNKQGKPVLSRLDKFRALIALRRGGEW
jgi:hypothetical protein